MNKPGSLLILLWFTLTAGLLQANSTPLFSMIPTTPTAFLLPVNFTKTVQYQVTNQTFSTRTMTLMPISGVSQDTSLGTYCQSPFTLAPQQSCLLTLQVNGSQIPATINRGPEICKTMGPGNNNPDPYLCAQPGQINWLGISSVPAGQHAYVTNWTGNSISLCQVNPVDGKLEDCTITANGFSNPEAIAMTPDGTYLYIANINNDTVFFCNVNGTTGALSACASTGVGQFDHPDGLAINPAGTLAYASNAGAPFSVSICSINPATGALNAPCTIANRAAFNVPSDMTLNTNGSLAYISNATGNNVSLCTTVGATIGDPCVNMDEGGLFNVPEGITLSPFGTHAYVSNNGDNKVIKCDVNSTTGILENCAATGGQFDGFGNITFNETGTRAYVPNGARNKVFVCSVDQVTGDLSECIDSEGSGFNNPSGILLR